MKAIETEYNGYRFRSRLEARWAVFFDAVGILYDYELEGFEFDSGMRYLPDFYLPELNMWVEVKGVLSDSDERKIKEFRRFLVKRKESLIVLRDIPPETEDVLDWIYDKYPGWESFSIGCDFPYVPCVCPACGKVGFEFDGRGWRICDHLNDSRKMRSIEEHELLQKEIYVTKNGTIKPMKYPEWKGWRMDDKGYTSNHPLILEGYKKARQARFEHGENPDG